MTTVRGLGRGLSALIPGAPVPSRAPDPESLHAPDERRMELVAPGRIHPNPQQPRQEFRQEELDALAASVRQHGILQPLVVTCRPDGDYELVAGERRLRASVIAGLAQVPVLVRGALDDREKLELALIENVQRQDLNPIERALAYRELQDRFGLTQEEIGARVGVSRSSVAHGLRLLALPSDIQGALRVGAITEGHGKLLASITDAAEQRAWFTRILEQKLPVAAVAAGRSGARAGAAARRPARAATTTTSMDPNIRAKALALQRALGAKVEIIPSGRGGQVAITYADPEELAGIVDAITH